uniref:Protein kinase domain-containing protein n=1 Tax=Glossina brevipalpis TaxID=37001 RepID=A0A1A9WUV0_9MUSC
MNSYMRQQATVSAEQMQHSFLKDKQAWENAIALYQGPDPLDHWWNYICWYENHGHGDPDNKFRETLERCLTLYEHSDYYKQDVRMVRLWLKYIDMQSNPLHFYQVLHQRGVGKQLASFYINWASYYESVNALKEAEAVYNLAFQEKAQPYAELHLAHSKFIYTKSVNAQQHHAVHYHLQQQQQQQQHVQHIQTAASGHASMHPPTAHNHNQYRQQVSYQHQAPPIGAVASSAPQNQQHTQIHTNHIIQQNPQLYHQTQPSANYPPHLQQPHQIIQQQLQHQVLAHSQIQQQSMQTPETTIQETLACTATSQATAQNISNPTHLHTHTTPQKHSQVAQQHNNVPVEQQLPAATASMSRQQYERALEASAKSQPVADECPVPCIRLPRKFVSYCRNSDETWQPALFLEEPYDPQRFCHYVKSLVYPEGEGVEYSPEEIKARRYIQTKHQQEMEKQNNECIKSAKVEPEIYVHNSQAYVELNHINNNNNHLLEDNSHEMQLQLQQAPSQSQYSYNSTNYDQQKRLQQIIQKENDVDTDGVERDGQGEEENGEDEAEEDENNETEEESDKNYHEQSYRADVINTDDLEDQIEASTISFKTEGSQNKTIKIKFKKERPTAGSGDMSNAYTIERIYQPEIESPSVPALDVSIKRNGHHSFHPYLLGHTSTPKTSAKRQKAKIKRASNKFPIVVSSNSNSSSAENGAAIATMTNTVENSAAINERKINYDRSIHNATFNDNANYSFSSAVALDNSNCSLSNAVGRLNFRDVSSITNTSLNHQSSVAADVSTYQENSYFATQNDAEAKETRLTRALETIERHMAKEAIDPFNSELCRAFLTKLDFPGTDGETHDNYKIIHTPLPKIANTRQLNLHGIQFHIDKEIGRGSYGSVYKATDVASGSVVALKFQKPANTWEIYICDQVLKRIKSASVLPGLMDISTAIIAPNASLIATEFSPYGSLLDINNKIRQATTKVMHESLVMHFSAQICSIIHHLHQNKIIHADIKPDNFLLMRVPSTELHFPSLRLIDFGCAIDMTLFPGGDTIKFRKIIQTDGFTCIEMQEGRSWSYETDLFCIAGTVHVMLFGEYMQLQKRAGLWDIKQKLPRYLKKHVWTQFFGDILNIKANQLPDLNAMRYIFEEETAKMDSELQKQMRTLSNILHRR